MHDLRKHRPYYQQSILYLLTALSTGYMSYFMYANRSYAPDVLAAALTGLSSALYLVAGLTAIHRPQHTRMIVLTAASLAGVGFIVHLLLVMSILFFCYRWLFLSTLSLYFGHTRLLA